ncbi:hypothetical protein, partial [Gemella cuniculi]|uniref:hypothetical protein n=1 Tax=Gemella cuniculi TaxID=150240 RepID=UPI0005529F6E
RKKLQCRLRDEIRFSREKNKGENKKSFSEYDPYKEIIEKESKVEYVKGKGLVLEKEELTKELLPKNYFLFQKLKLNKEVFKQWKFDKKEYSFETGNFDIVYNVSNREFNKYFDIEENSNLSVRIGGVDVSTINIYRYRLSTRGNNLNYYELVSDSKEDIENAE